VDTTETQESSASYPRDARSEERLEPAELPCFRCGVCCTVYQVRISPAEARCIAASLDLDYWDWVGRYCDPRWSDPRSHLIRHDKMGCVFLDYSKEQESLCRIYAVRPDSCRQWAASAFKPACQEGLKRNWSLSVDSEGRLLGAPDARQRFERFLAKL
jgi:Fe-S-cluster containining protein